EEKDNWSYQSHHRAISATKSGKFKDDNVAGHVPKRKRDTDIVETDEAPKKYTTVEKLRPLHQAYDKDGSVTAGKAQGLYDDGCAFVVKSDEKANTLVKKPLATIISHTAVGVEAENFPQSTGIVINELLNKTGMTKEDIVLFEINEAFAAVSLASTKIAGIDSDKINVNGGAVALGHPIGASGARIVLTLIHELKR